ncbi:MAG: PEGA domain-containing protein [Candidatus Saccharimonadales bacterium]
MYRQPSKRKQLLRRISIYSVMSTAVIVLVAILVFFMLGYQFNRADGTIEQGGLVQFNTQPTGADVIIDGKTLGTRTASRKTLDPGQHYITMQREGYKTWQKSIDVTAGGVLWLTYARLVPNDLTPKNMASFATVSSTAASPDNRWMAIKEDPATPTIRLANLSRDDVEVTTLEIPEASYTAPSADKSQSFSLEKWNPSSRFILVKHTYDDTKIEWIVVDSQNIDATKNITTQLGIEATKLTFTSNNASVLYALVDSGVRKIDLGAMTVSGPLVSSVAEFSLYDNTRIVYTTLPDPATNVRSVGYHDEGAAKSRTLRSYSDSGQVPLHISVGKYFDDFYVALAYDQTVEVMKGALPRSDTTNPSALTAYATMSVPGGVQYLSIVTNGRFVVAQTPTSYVVNDLELKKMTTTTVSADAPLQRELRWLDGFTVWNDQTGTLRSYEFDGGNQHDLMPVAPGLSVTYSPNAKYLYSMFKSTDDKFHLQRVQMILP